MYGDVILVKLASKKLVSAYKFMSKDFRSKYKAKDDKEFFTREKFLEAKLEQERCFMSKWSQFLLKLVRLSQW